MHLRNKAPFSRKEVIVNRNGQNICLGEELLNVIAPGQMWDQSMHLFAIRVGCRANIVVVI